MSTAEQMAYEFERGEADIRIGNSGKGRTKLEQVFPLFNLILFLKTFRTSRKLFASLFLEEKEEEKVGSVSSGHHLIFIS